MSHHSAADELSEMIGRLEPDAKKISELKNLLGYLEQSTVHRAVEGGATQHQHEQAGPFGAGAESTSESEGSSFSFAAASLARAAARSTPAKTDGSHFDTTLTGSCESRFGAQVCSNVMVAVMDTVIKPNFTTTASTQHKHTIEVVTLFRRLVDILHHDRADAPFEYKAGKALTYLLVHIIDVLRNPAAPSRIHGEYGILLGRLLSRPRYASLFTLPTIDIFFGLLRDLIKRALQQQVENASNAKLRLEKLNEAAAFAEALSHLVRLSNWFVKQKTLAAVAKDWNTHVLLPSHVHDEELVKHQMPILRVSAAILAAAEARGVQSVVHDIRRGLERIAQMFRFVTRKAAWKNEAANFLAAYISCCEATGEYELLRGLLREHLLGGAAEFVSYFCAEMNVPSPEALRFATTVVRASLVLNPVPRFIAPTRTASTTTTTTATTEKDFSDASKEKCNQKEAAGRNGAMVAAAAVVPAKMLGLGLKEGRRRPRGNIDLNNLDGTSVAVVEDDNENDDNVSDAYRIVLRHSLATPCHRAAWCRILLRCFPGITAAQTVIDATAAQAGDDERHQRRSLSLVSLVRQLLTVDTTSVSGHISSSSSSARMADAANIATSILDPEIPVKSWAQLHLLDCAAQQQRISAAATSSTSATNNHAKNNNNRNAAAVVVSSSLAHAVGLLHRFFAERGFIHVMHAENLLRLLGTLPPQVATPDVIMAFMALPFGSNTNNNSSSATVAALMGAAASNNNNNNNGSSPSSSPQLSEQHQQHAQQLAVSASTGMLLRKTGGGKISFASSIGALSDSVFGSESALTASEFSSRALLLLATSITSSGAGNLITDTSASFAAESSGGNGTIAEAASAAGTETSSSSSVDDFIDFVRAAWCSASPEAVSSTARVLARCAKRGAARALLAVVKQPTRVDSSISSSSSIVNNLVAESALRLLFFVIARQELSLLCHFSALSTSISSSNTAPRLSAGDASAEEYERSLLRFCEKQIIRSARSLELALHGHATTTTANSLKKEKKTNIDKNNANSSKSKKQAQQLDLLLDESSDDDDDDDDASRRQTGKHQNEEDDDDDFVCASSSARNPSWRLLRGVLAECSCTAWRSVICIMSPAGDEKSKAAAAAAISMTMYPVCKSLRNICRLAVIDADNGASHVAALVAAMLVRVGDPHTVTGFPRSDRVREALSETVGERSDLKRLFLMVPEHCCTVMSALFLASPAHARTLIHQMIESPVLPDMTRLRLVPTVLRHCVDVASWWAFAGAEYGGADCFAAVTDTFSGSERNNNNNTTFTANMRGGAGEGQQSSSNNNNNNNSMLESLLQGSNDTPWSESMDMMAMANDQPQQQQRQQTRLLVPSFFLGKELTKLLLQMSPNGEDMFEAGHAEPVQDAIFDVTRRIVCGLCSPHDRGLLMMRLISASCTHHSSSVRRLAARAMQEATLTLLTASAQSRSPTTARAQGKNNSDDLSGAPVNMSPLAKGQLGYAHDAKMVSTLFLPIWRDMAPRMARMARLGSIDEIGDAFVVAAACAMFDSAVPTAVLTAAFQRLAFESTLRKKRAAVRAANNTNNAGSTTSKSTTNDKQQQQTRPQHVEVTGTPIEIVIRRCIANFCDSLGGATSNAMSLDADRGGNSSSGRRFSETIDTGSLVGHSRILGALVPFFPAIAECLAFASPLTVSINAGGQPQQQQQQAVVDDLLPSGCSIAFALMRDLIAVTAAPRARRNNRLFVTSVTDPPKQLEKMKQIDGAPTTTSGASSSSDADEDDEDDETGRRDSVAAAGRQQQHQYLKQYLQGSMLRVAILRMHYDPRQQQQQQKCGQNEQEAQSLITSLQNYIKQDPASRGGGGTEQRSLVTRHVSSIVAYLARCHVLQGFTQDELSATETDDNNNNNNSCSKYTGSASAELQLAVEQSCEYVRVQVGSTLFREHVLRHFDEVLADILDEVELVAQTLPHPLIVQRAWSIVLTKFLGQGSADAARLVGDSDKVCAVMERYTSRSRALFCAAQDEAIAARRTLFFSRLIAEWCGDATAVTSRGEDDAEWNGFARLGRSNAAPAAAAGAVDAANVLRVGALISSAHTARRAVECTLLIISCLPHLQQHCNTSSRCTSVSSSSGITTTTTTTVFRAHALLVSVLVRAFAALARADSDAACDMFPACCSTLRGVQSRWTSFELVAIFSDAVVPLLPAGDWRVALVAASTADGTVVRSCSQVEAAVSIRSRLERHDDDDEDEGDDDGGKGRHAKHHSHEKILDYISVRRDIPCSGPALEILCDFFDTLELRGQRCPAAARGILRAVRHRLFFDEKEGSGTSTLAACVFDALQPHCQMSNNGGDMNQLVRARGISPQQMIAMQHRFVQFFGDETTAATATTGTGTATSSSSSTITGSASSSPRTTSDATGLLQLYRAVALAMMRHRIENPFDDLHLSGGEANNNNNNNNAQAGGDGGATSSAVGAASPDSMDLLAGASFLLSGDGEPGTVRSSFIPEAPFVQGLLAGWRHAVADVASTVARMCSQWNHPVQRFLAAQLVRYLGERHRITASNASPSSTAATNSSVTIFANAAARFPECKSLLCRPSVQLPTASAGPTSNNATTAASTSRSIISATVVDDDCDVERSLLFCANGDIDQDDIWEGPIDFRVVTPTLLLSDCIKDEVLGSAKFLAGASVEVARKLFVMAVVHVFGFGRQIQAVHILRDALQRRLAQMLQRADRFPDDARVALQTANILRLCHIAVAREGGGPGSSSVDRKAPFQLPNKWLLCTFDTQLLTRAALICSEHHRAAQFLETAAESVAGQRGLTTLEEDTAASVMHLLAGKVMQGQHERALNRNAPTSESADAAPPPATGPSRVSAVFGLISSTRSQAAAAAATATATSKQVGVDQAATVRTGEKKREQAAAIAALRHFAASSLAQINAVLRPAQVQRVHVSDLVDADCLLATATGTSSSSSSSSSSSAAFSAANLLDQFGLKTVAQALRESAAGGGGVSSSSLSAAAASSTFADMNRAVREAQRRQTTWIDLEEQSSLPGLWSQNLTRPQQQPAAAMVNSSPSSPALSSSSYRATTGNASAAMSSLPWLAWFDKTIRSASTAMWENRPLDVRAALALAESLLMRAMHCFAATDADLCARIQLVRDLRDRTPFFSRVASLSAEYADQERASLLALVQRVSGAAGKQQQQQQPQSMKALDIIGTDASVLLSRAALAVDPMASIAVKHFSSVHLRDEIILDHLVRGFNSANNLNNLNHHNTLAQTLTSHAVVAATRALDASEPAIALRLLAQCPEVHARDGGGGINEATWASRVAMISQALEEMGESRKAVAVLKAAIDDFNMGAGNDDDDAPVTSNSKRGGGGGATAAASEKNRQAVASLARTGHRAHLLGHLVALQHRLQLVPTTTLAAGEICDAAGCDVEARFTLARLSDRLFQDIASRRQSLQHKEYQAQLEKSKREADDMKKRLKTHGATMDSETKKRFNAGIVAVLREANMDEEERTRVNEQMASAWKQAITSYRVVLRFGDSGIAGGAKVGADATGSEQQAHFQQQQQQQHQQHSSRDLHCAFRQTALWYHPSAAAVRASLAAASMVATADGAAAVVVKTEDGEPDDAEKWRGDPFDRVPSHKLVFLYPQLAARLGGNDAAAKILSRTLQRVAADHPHHCLWVLLALSNGDQFAKDEQQAYKIDPDKIAAAKEILSNLEEPLKILQQQQQAAAEANNTNSTKKKQQQPLQPQHQFTPKQLMVAQMVDQARLLSNAYLQVAFAELPSKSNKEAGTEHKLASFVGLVKDAKDLHLTVLPTLTVPVSPLATYDARLLPTVVRFLPLFKLVGGINAPRKVFATVSTGSPREHRQLVKARDDLRQDCVVQQVFELCNTLFRRGTSASDRALRDHRIRTYGVVPLSPTSGVLQWVDSTATLASYLVGDDTVEQDGAHMRYYPGEMSHGEARKRMYEANTTEAKIKSFKDICDNFTPAFHHFFSERFGDPATWFERMSAYSRSAACCSFIGYLVGLGDRHASNLLLDTRSAELLHIDFGMAFEQSLLLPVPERVPFRLTRDLVDALGVEGVSGSFQFHGRHVLRALREHRELFITVLEVFLHDPIARWSINLNFFDQPAPADQQQQQQQQLQGKTTAAGREDDAALGSSALRRQTSIVVNKRNNADADRALSRVRDKLNGYESGEYLGVESQVTKLVAAATERDNLAQLFCGWSAWL